MIKISVYLLSNFPDVCELELSDIHVCNLAIFFKVISVETTFSHCHVI